MDINDIKDNLKYEAAKIMFDKLDRKAVEENFNALMNQGTWIDEFLDIEFLKDTPQADFKPAFKAALKKLDIEIPSSKEEALQIILRKNISEIANEKVEPLIGLQQLIDTIYWDADIETDMTSKTTKYYGDSHGIEYLIGAYWKYDDMRGEHLHIYNKAKYDEEIQKLEKAIIDTSKDWIKKYK